MKALMAPIMAIIFLGWVIYITLVTKTLSKHKDEVFAGFCFLAVWAVIIIIAL
jgi:hypothetical protein